MNLHVDLFAGRYLAAMRSRRPNGEGDVTTRPAPRPRSAPWAPSLDDQLESLFDSVWKAEREARRLPFTWNSTR